MGVHQDLFEIADRLAAVASAGREASVQTLLSALDAAADAVGQASSGSWLGYHSRIYYANFQEPLPGAHFSQEWGLMSAFDEEGMLFPGVMAAMPPRTATKVIYEQAPPPSPAAQKPEKQPQSDEEAESPDTPAAPARPAGQTIVPPR